ncbi:MAG: T9SS type A sorting domain-containing protein [Bacteroidota bacterium]
MKKALLLTIFTAVCLLNLSAQDTTFVEVWAHYGENSPEWFTDGTEAAEGDNSWSGVERGIVYSDYSGHLYVASRHAEDVDADGTLDWGEPHVYILDPATGEAATDAGLVQLMTMGITSGEAGFGGGYPLNNVTATVDGSIIACNMTLASGPEVNDDGIAIKAFKVYRWIYEGDIPAVAVDYREGGYRLGDKFSVIGNWDTEAYIYAGANETTKLLRWKVTAGIVDEAPTIITLEDIAGMGTSPTVAPSLTKDEWIYVSGKGFMPTLFTTGGDNLTQVGIATADKPSLIAGRTISYYDKNYMAMFAGDQRAFVFDITKNGENVTDVDVVGFTPAFGTKFDNAYGEGAVEFGIINDKLHVFICAPSNGIACYRITGLAPNAIEKRITERFNVSAYPNPAGEFSNISFTLPKDTNGAVAVKLFDISGRFIGITADEANGGEQEMRINTSELSSGQYIYQVVYKNEINTGKLMIK